MSEPLYRIVYAGDGYVSVTMPWDRVLAAVRLWRGQPFRRQLGPVRVERIR